MNDTKNSFTDRINDLKSIATLSREVIIIVVIAFIFLWPGNFKKIMEQAGFKQFDFGFGTWESELVESTANLQDANQVMEQYQKELEDIKNSMAALTESPNIDEETKEEVVKINNQIEKTWDASKMARVNIEGNIEQQNRFIKEIRQEQSLPPMSLSGRWAIVAGADREVESAMFEVDQLKEKGYPNVQLWKRDGWYRTVIIFEDREAAENDLRKLKKAFRESAFITNLHEWCPDPIEIKEGLIFECRDR